MFFFQCLTWSLVLLYPWKEQFWYYNCCFISSPFVFKQPSTAISYSKPEHFFGGCGLCSCNILTKTNNFGLGDILLLCLVSKKQRTSSPRLEPRRFRDWSLCSCNLLAETNNFGLGAILLSWLVSELQKPPSLGLEPRILFGAFDLSKIFSWFQGIHMPSLGQIGRSVFEL
jgi:hypothetical protein